MVLIVAMPFSTVSGVPVRSCEPSLGAIFVALTYTTTARGLGMIKSGFELWWMKLWIQRSLPFGGMLKA